MSTRLDVTKVATALRESKRLREEANRLYEQATALHKNATESCPHPATFNETVTNEDDYGKTLPSTYITKCFLCEAVL